MVEIRIVIQYVGSPGSCATCNGELVVNGNVSLAGALSISMLNGFVPANLQTFIILTYNSLTGTFSALNIFNDPNQTSSVIYSFNGLDEVAVQFTNVSTSNVPEPSSLLLLGTGLLGLGWKLRRRIRRAA